MLNVLQPYHSKRPLWKNRVLWAIFYTLLTLTAVLYGFLVAVLPLSLYLWLAIPILLLALILIWALPDFKSPPTRALIFLFFAYWTGYILWPDYLAIAIPGLPWISVRRIFAFPLVAILFICISCSSGVRENLKLTYKKNPWIFRLFLLFTFVQVASIPFSHKIMGSISIFFRNQIMWTPIFIAAVYIFSDVNGIRRWVKLTCAFSIIVSIIAIIEWTQQQILWVNYIPSFLSVDTDAVNTALSGKFRGGAYRSSGTFILPLTMAEYLSASIPFILYLMFKSGHNIRRTFVWIVAYIAVLGGILASGSRLGMVGFVIAHVGFIFMWAARHKINDTRNLIASAVVYAYPTALIALVGLIFSSHRVYRLILGGGEHQSSDNARRVQWDMAWPKIFENPIFGHGPGTSGETLGYFTPGGILTVDSYFITILLDYGFIGFIAFYGMILLSIIKAGREGIVSSDKNSEILIPIGCSLAVFFVIKFVLSQADNHSMIFMLVAASLTFQSKREDRSLANSTQ